MAGYSKFFLAEQIRFRLEEGYPPALASVMQEDVIAAIGQKINSMLKLEYFAQTLNVGDSIPNALMIATYEGVAVTPIKGNKAKCTLPVMPVSLPRNMGVWEIVSPSDLSRQFIPLQPGQLFMLQGQPMIEDLLGQVGYTVYGNTIEFTPDITINNLDTVKIRLLVVDIDSYDIYTPLPISADYAQTIIDEVYKSFLPIDQMALQEAQAKQEPIKAVKK